MNIVILNGSPRKAGNTSTAIKAFADGIQEFLPDAHHEVISVAEVQVGPCTNCDGCKRAGKCVQKDDSARVIERVEQADLIVFASPVYWWGVTAQMKCILDKFYSRAAQLQQTQKKAICIFIGEDEVDAAQYRIMSEQFACISAYLGWKLMFVHNICAFEEGDLRNNEAELGKLRSLAQLYK